MESVGGTWTIVEREFRKEHAKAYEGLFTIGSGYLHCRGSLPEHMVNAPQNTTFDRRAANVTSEKFPDTVVKWGTYVPGMWGAHPTLGRELINLPHPLTLLPIVDGEPLDMTRCRISAYQRTLHMNTAHIERTLTWQTKSENQIDIRYEMFVHGPRKHVILQRLTLTSRQSADVEIRAGIDADVRTNGYDHFKTVRLDKTANGIACQVVTENQRMHGVSGRGQVPSTWILPVVARQRAFISQIAGRSGK